MGEGDVFGDIEPVLLVCDGDIPGIQQGLNEFQSFLACGGELTARDRRRHDALVGIHIAHEEGGGWADVRKTFQFQHFFGLKRFNLELAFQPFAIVPGSLAMHAYQGTVFCAPPLKIPYF